jgi:hypothetical protein
MNVDWLRVLVCSFVGSPFVVLVGIAIGLSR